MVSKKIAPSPFLVTRFFQLISENKFANAQRLLQRIQHQAPKDKWTKGYLNALEGMLLAKENKNDKYVFIHTINPKDTEQLQQLRKEFTQDTKNRFHGNYNQGFFKAWADYTRLLIRIGATIA